MSCDFSFFLRLVRNMKLAGNAEKVAVVVGTITNDLRLVGKKKSYPLLFAYDSRAVFAFGRMLTVCLAPR